MRCQDALPEVTVSDQRPAAITPEQPSAVADGASLVTESNDPAELRDLLARARERLAFYEGFDRLIGENLRRSGELMQETISIREQVVAAGSGAERERLSAELDDVAGRLDEVGEMVQALVARVTGLQRDLRGGPAGPPPASPGDLLPADSTIAPEEPVYDRWEAAGGIDIVAHQVPRAAVAVALQDFLNGLEPVSSVEAREFAGGILRLHVSASRPLREEDFAGWSGGGSLAVLQCGPNAIEVSLG
jgi:hypothetical protein